MNIQELIDDVVSEVSYRTGNGLVDFQNGEHLYILSEVLTEMGLDGVKDELIEALTEAEKEKEYKNPLLNKVIPYKNVNDEDAEGKVGDLLRRPDEEDAYKQAVKALGSKDSDEYKKAMDDLGAEGQPNRDIEGEREKDDNPKEEPKEEPQTGTALKTPTYQKQVNKEKEIQKKLDATDNEETDDMSTDAESSDGKKNSKTEFKKLPSTKQKSLKSAREIVDKSNPDENTKKAFDVFEENFNKLLNAETLEEQLDAIRTLAESGFIERNGSGKKLYISNLPIGYKHMTGENDTLAKYVNSLAEENEIDIPLRSSTSTRSLADVSGKHNESGVVSLLDPSVQNKNEYDRFREEYSQFGGDEEEAHNQNLKAVDAINSEIQKLYPNGKVKSATQIGGIGEKRLKELGINPKKDPTDIIIEIELEDGSTKMMKVSMKVYSDPNDITMKNSGLGDAGSNYLGFPEIDSELTDIRSRNNWREPGISDGEMEKRKRKFREEYLTKFSSKMVELSQSAEGQQKLLDMWKEVHGCGNDVFTSVTNKKTGETKIYPPAHYCEPKTPFKVEYNGVKVAIRMGGEDTGSVLEIVCKTETSGPPKLLFKHKKVKSK
jgi:hypothetical protein